MQRSSNTAVLVFTRTAVEEAMHKAYALNANINTKVRIARRLINHTVQQAEATGLDVYKVDSDHQVGNTFGERLLNAIEGIYNDGYDNVIAIGTDAPDLLTEHISEVAEQLHTHTCVLGPSKDGGISILGINKSAYSREQLINISWQTTKVYQQLEQCFKQDHNLAIAISPIGDIDDDEAFGIWLKNAEQNELTLLILDILCKDGIDPINDDSSLTSSSAIDGSFLRGPPFAMTYSKN